MAHLMGLSSASFGKAFDFGPQLLLLPLSKPAPVTPVSTPLPFPWSCFLCLEPLPSLAGYSQASLRPWIQGDFLQEAFFDSSKFLTSGGESSLSAWSSFSSAWGRGRSVGRELVGPRLLSLRESGPW